MLANLWAAVFPPTQGGSAKFEGSLLCRTNCCTACVGGAKSCNQIMTLIVSGGVRLDSRLRRWEAFRTYVAAAD